MLQSRKQVARALTGVNFFHNNTAAVQHNIATSLEATRSQLQLICVSVQLSQD